MSPRATVVPADFRTGAIALRIRRGATHFLVPRAWVRSVAPLTGLVGLPRTKPWVLGMALHQQQPLPVLDPAACAGQTAEKPAAAVLIGAADAAPIALLATDIPGRFVSVPASAQLEPGSGWVLGVTGLPAATWWVDVSRLSAVLGVK